MGAAELESPLSADFFLRSCLETFVGQLRDRTTALAADGIRFAHAVAIFVDEHGETQASCMKQLDEKPANVTMLEVEDGKETARVAEKESTLLVHVGRETERTLLVQVGREETRHSETTSTTETTTPAASSPDSALPVKKAKEETVHTIVRRRRRPCRPLFWLIPLFLLGGIIWLAKRQRHPPSE